MINGRSTFNRGIDGMDVLQERQGKHHKPLVKEFLVGFFGRQAMDSYSLVVAAKQCM